MLSSLHVYDKIPTCLMGLYGQTALISFSLVCVFVWNVGFTLLVLKHLLFITTLSLSRSISLPSKRKHSHEAEKDIGWRWLKWAIYSLKEKK